MKKHDFSTDQSTIQKLLNVEFLDLDDPVIFTKLDAEEIKNYLVHLSNFKIKNHFLEIGKLIYLLFDKPINGFVYSGCLADSLGLGTLESLCRSLNITEVYNNKSFYILLGMTYYDTLKAISKEDREIFFSIPLSKLKSLIGIVNEENFYQVSAIGLSKTASEIHSIYQWYMDNREKLGENCLTEFIKINLDNKSLERSVKKGNENDFVFERLCFYPEQAEVFKTAIEKCSKISNSRVKSQLVYLIMADFVMTTSTTSLSNANKTLYFTRLCEIMGLEACIVEKSTNRIIMNTLFNEELQKENE